MIKKLFNRAPLQALIGLVNKVFNSFNIMILPLKEASLGPS